MESGGSLINGQVIQDIVIAIGIIGGSLLYYKSRLPRQTIKDLETHARAQDIAIKDLQEENKQHIRTIADLQGQIKVYKELPLRELADGIKTVAASNEEILQELRNSSIIAAEDRDIVVKKK